MKRSDLPSLRKNTVVVEHDGNHYTLKNPSWEGYHRIQKHLMKSAGMKDADILDQMDGTMDLMVIAIQETMHFTDDPSPCTAEEAQEILMGTGNHNSPVAVAALKQCGVEWAERNPGEDDDEEANLPF